VTYHSLISQRAISQQVHGFLYLRPQALRLILLDADGVTVDARFLMKDEVISSGSEVALPCHVVKVGPLETPAPPQAQVQQSSPSFGLRSDISLQKKLWNLFYCPVALSSSHSLVEFFMAASFGHSKLRLDSLSFSHAPCLPGWYTPGLQCDVLA
jgi:hypothetical protein